MKCRFALGGVWLWVLSVTSAHAEINYGALTLSAFGTLGGAWFSNPHIELVQGTQPTGPGLTHDFDLGYDSRIGAQLNIALSKSTLVTAQSVLERLSDNQYLPRLSQLNLRQEINDNLALRIGRIQSPAFMASNYRLANFSNPWARTPGVVYNLYPLTHLDSAEFTFKHDTPLGLIALNAGYGWLEYPTPTFPNGARSTANLKLDDVFYSNIELENGAWHFKISWLQARSTIHVTDIDQFIGYIASLDQQAGQALSSVNRVGNLYTAGFSYDSKDWLLMAEWAIAKAKHPYAFGSYRHGGYLTAGYRFGRWMPHLTIGYQATGDRRVHSDNPIADGAIAQFMKAQRTDYQTMAIGLNYSPIDSIMLRGQLDLIQPMGNSIGPYFRNDGHYNFKNPSLETLFSLSLDFVF